MAAPTQLNVFQRLTRQWDSLHPYNAGQMMKLAGPADRDALRAAWNSTLRELGLGIARVTGDSYLYEACDDAELIQIPRDDSLESFITTELNRPFDSARGLPFRGFVHESSGAHYVGIIYHHWVADSFSIRVLLREWFLRLHEPGSARRRSLRIASRGYWSLFGPGRANWSIDSALLGLFRWSAHFRKARRIEPDGFKDLSVHFTMHEAPDGLIERIAATSKKLGATVNDIFLAAMAQVCDELVPLQRNPKRPNLAMGTIVDLRSRSSEKIDDTFGLFLGFTSVFCRAEDLREPIRLLARVHQQNVMQKNTAAAESSMIRMLAGLTVARILKRKALLEFYRKRLGLAGGISNVNLNRDWPGRYHPTPMLDYIRISPAGPMMPLVFTPTTIGRSMNFGLTCRTSVIPPERATMLASAFIQRLEEFTKLV